MTFSITDFHSAIGTRGGLMRTNRFLLTFTVPPVLQGVEGSLEMARDMEYWCKAANLPGYQLGTSTVNRWTYGPGEKRPFTPIYQPISCVFNSDASGTYMQFFNAWLQYIMPHDWYNGGMPQASNFEAMNGGRGQYDVEYKQNYATDLNIAVINPDGTIPLLYFIKEAFPVAVSDVTFDWEDNNQNAKFQVNFEYLDWTTTTQAPDTINQEYPASDGFNAGDLPNGPGNNPNPGNGNGTGVVTSHGSLGIDFPQGTVKLPFDYPFTK